MITLMGNSSGLILQRVSTAVAASTHAGVVGSLRISAANSLLSLIPSGNLVQPFLPGTDGCCGLS